MARRIAAKRDRHNQLLVQLETDRASRETFWKDIGDHLMPMRPRFNLSENNRGERRNQKILDNTPVTAKRTLNAAMVSGITNPATEWFLLTHPDPQINEIAEVQEWAHEVTQRMLTMIAKSNAYDAFDELYGDGISFGTSVMFIEEDFEDTIRCTTFAIGQFYLGINNKNDVDLFMREFQMTVRQIVQEFGMPPGQIVEEDKIDWTNISATVRNLWETEHKEQEIDICHIIEPNPEFDPDRMEARFKRYASSYFERGVASRGNTAVGQVSTAEDQEKYLRESGFDEFPVVTFRWKKAAGESYGTDCPGMESLGDNKELQHDHRKGAQAIDKHVNPPLQGPKHFKKKGVSLLPGHVNYGDLREGQKGLSPLYQVDPKLEAHERRSEQIRGRIRRSFFEDIILALSSEGKQMTATEVIQRAQEKVEAFGRVIERLQRDVLKPFIDRCFNIMLMQGQLPPPPEQLLGVDLKVEYLSIMAKAQKAVALGGIEQFTNFVLQIHSTQPQVADLIDWDKVITRYADSSSIPPDLTHDEETVQQIRAARAAAEAQERQMAQAQAMAKAAKDAAAAKTDDDNVLTNLGRAAAANREPVPAGA